MGVHDMMHMHIPHGHGAFEMACADAHAALFDSSPRSLQHSAGTNDSVKFIQRLGSGVFGEVWKAEYNGELVAGKTTECPSGFRVEETELLRKAQGSKVVRLLAEEKGTPKGTVIVMELCAGSLEDRVAARTETDEAAFLDELEQILEGLVALHDMHIIFGDVKPDNLLVNADGQIVFADFGDARDARVDYRSRSPHELGWGAPMYHARPDVMNQNLTTASDMWMVAQTAVHLWSCEKAVTNPSPLPRGIPLQELLQRCTATDPKDRPTAQEALAMVQQSKKWNKIDGSITHSHMRETNKVRRRSSLPPSALPSSSGVPEPEGDQIPRRRGSVQLDSRGHWVGSSAIGELDSRGHWVGDVSPVGRTLAPAGLCDGFAGFDQQFAACHGWPMHDMMHHRRLPWVCGKQICAGLQMVHVNYYSTL